MQFDSGDMSGLGVRSTEFHSSFGDLIRSDLFVRVLKICGLCGLVFTVQIFHSSWDHSVRVGECETSQVACGVTR